MNNARRQSNTKRFCRVMRSALAMLVFAITQSALAEVAVPVLSDTPIANTTSVQVKPNIMLLMDTSNSMRFTHMPDEIEGSNFGAFPIGYKSYQCNVLYYKPTQTYALPKDSTGALLPLPTFGAAFKDVYAEYKESPSTNPTTLVNLNIGFQAYETTTRQNAMVSDLAQPAYYYIYTEGGVEPASKSFSAAPCTDLDTGTSATTTIASGSGIWTRVLVSSLSAAQQKNFAIWYSYYRTRLSMIKSAVSLSFTPLTPSYRVGLITVKPYSALVPTVGDSVNLDNYLAIGDFDTSQRQNWFAKLFSQLPGGSSPAREGLARVGRHYAGKHDSINTGMGGDPVQYSCQQNFTIMTTDGYWNTAAETTGPVRLDGVTLIGQQDGTLNKTVPDPNSASGTINIVPRPIWDGFGDTTRVKTEKVREYSFDACTSLYGPATTTQNLRSTVQNLQSTTQMLQSTRQNLQSTVQKLKSTVQNLKSTSQMTQSTQQNLQSTVQNRKSTVQNLQSTTQNVQTSTQITTQTQQITKSTVQNRKSTVQNLQSTSQMTQSTQQKLQSTVQNRKSTVQNLQSTSQMTQSTQQNLKSTVQNLKSTVQNLQNTVQKLQSTSQWFAYDSSTELTVPVASCTNGGTITCTHIVTTNVPVANCTAAAASSGNSWTTTTCPTPVVTTNVPVASCTAAAASSGNSYTTTTCPAPVVTTSVPVASCTAAAASSSNSYTTTTCPAPVVTSSVPVATCTAAAASSSNSYTTTTCPTPITTGPTGVSSCSAVTASSSNSYTSTTCTPVTTTSVPVATCTAAAANSGNSWTTTTCPTPVVTTNVPVASCTVAAASSSNSWTTTTCPAPVVTTSVPVATCTAAAASSSNSYTTTTCPTPITTGPTGVSSCSAVTASSSNSYTSTTCTPVTTSSVPVATCTATAASAGNSWTTTTCPTPVVTTNVPVATCAAAAASSSNSYTTTTCPAPVVTTNVPVATCTAAAASSSNSYTTTTCVGPTILTGPTPTQTCTAVTAAAANGYVATVCGSIVSTVAVATCTPQTASAGNNWTTITCPAPVVTTNVPVATCTAAVASAGNNWTTITCPAPIVTTNVPVATCTAAAAASGNNWTTTTCPAPVTTTSVPVLSCTVAAASSSNSYTTTTCPTPITTGPTGVSSCTTAVASSANSYTSTTCTPVTTTSVPVVNCAAAVASSGNNWTTTTCPTPVVTTNVPVASCTAAGASSSNSYTTTTCPAPVTTSSVPVVTCTAAVASSSNSYTTTTCPAAITTGPTGVSSCTTVAASSANSYTSTTCTPNNTTSVPVATCTASVASSGNNWTATTCPAPAVTTNVPVATCAAAGASSSNSYTTTTCPAPVVSTVPEVYNCLPVAALSGNSWTSTSCGTKLPGKELKARVATTVTSTTLSGVTVIDGPTTGATTYDPATGYAVTNGICVPNSSTLVSPLVVPADGPPSTTDLLPPAEPADTPETNYTLTCPGNFWPCTLETVSTVGSSNSLADVAQYYYATDLRTGPLWDSDLAATPKTLNDNVTAAGPGAEDDNAPWQHMTTFTIALGVSGTVNFAPTYKDIPSGSADFTGIRTGTRSWPIWPDSSLDYAHNGTLYSNPKSIDDFWHTAVDGRGRYFSAGKPSDVVDGLRSVLNDLGKKQGSGAASAASSQAPVQGDNIAYVAKYSTTTWTGDIEAHEIDLTAGTVLSPVLWSAQPLLDAKSGYFCDNRKIYLFRSGASNNMVDFKWNSGTCSTQTIAESSSATVTAGTVTALTITPQTATVRTGAGTPRDIGVNDAILAGDVVTTSAAATVTIKNTATAVLTTITGGTTATIAFAGTVTAVNTTPTATAKTGADAPRVLNVADTILASDVVATSAGAVVSIEHVVSPVTTLDASEKAYFGSAKVVLLSQHPDMSDGTDGNPNQRVLAQDDNLANFIRGQRGHEGFVTKDAVKFYRKRASVLGDFVDAQPVYVKAPFASYGDAGYSAFKANLSAGGASERKGMIYAAANDGMLHAFYAGAVSSSGGVTSIDSTGGKEAWAFIPTMVLDNLYKLADNDYANRHTFLVDGTPSIGDVWDAAAVAWKTVLVAGLNKGGKGYYALDVTDPDNPQALWEFKQSSTCFDPLLGSNQTTDCNLGYTFGKPVITKLANGTWVVLVTSGYNNVSGAVGDGGGYLYVLNAMTGKIITKVASGQGNATTPSGLAQISNFVDNGLIDNTTKFVYGGDNSGNIWRFNINEVVDDPLTIVNEAVAAEALLLGKARDSSDRPQPITTRPELGEISGHPWVYIGTGRLLGEPDLIDIHAQSVYGFDASTTYTDAVAYPLGVRSALRPLAISPTTAANANPVAGTTRTAACTGTSAECARTSGWVVDLPDSGERVNVDLTLDMGTLYFASNVPRNTACNIGGYSWLNYLNFRTGLAVEVQNANGSLNDVVSSYVGDVLAVGLGIIRVQPPTGEGGSNGNAETSPPVTKIILNTSDGKTPTFTPPVAIPVPLGKRVSWRELVQ